MPARSTASFTAHRAWSMPSSDANRSRVSTSDQLPCLAAKNDANPTSLCTHRESVTTNHNDNVTPPATGLALDCFDPVRPPQKGKQHDTSNGFNALKTKGSVTCVGYTSSALLILRTTSAAPVPSLPYSATFAAFNAVVSSATTSTRASTNHFTLRKKPNNATKDAAAAAAAAVNNRQPSYQASSLGG